jgi:hypothetical protein
MRLEDWSSQCMMCHGSKKFRPAGIEDIVGSGLKAKCTERQKITAEASKLLARKHYAISGAESVLTVPEATDMAVASSRCPPP